MHIEGQVRITIELPFTEVYDRDELVRTFLDELNKVFVAGSVTGSRVLGTASADVPPASVLVLSPSLVDDAYPDRHALASSQKPLSLEACFREVAAGEKVMAALQALRVIGEGSMPDIITQIQRGAAPGEVADRMKGLTESGLGSALKLYYKRLVEGGVFPPFQPRFVGALKRGEAQRWSLREEE